MTDQKQCTLCNYVGQPRVKNKGSGLVCFVLLCCFMLPGIIYLAYMVSGRVDVCPRCKSENKMIPIRK